MANTILTEGITPPIATPPAPPADTIGIGEIQNGLTTNIATPPPPPQTFIIK